MPIYEEDRPVERRIVEEPVVERRVVEEQEVVPRRRASNDLANYALVKYGFTLLMTIIILYFVARYLIPMVR